MKPIFSNFPIFVLLYFCPAIASDQLFVADKLRSKCRVRIIPLRRKKKSTTDFFFILLWSFFCLTWKSSLVWTNPNRRNFVPTPFTINNVLYCFTSSHTWALLIISAALSFGRITKKPVSLFILVPFLSFLLFCWHSNKRRTIGFEAGFVSLSWLGDQKELEYLIATELRLQVWKVTSTSEDGFVERVPGMKTIRCQTSSRKISWSYLEFFDCAKREFLRLCNFFLFRVHLQQILFCLPLELKGA